MRRAALVFAVAGLGVVLLSGCGRSELESARNRWKAAGPSAYQYTLRWNCFCEEEFTRATRITVRDTKVVEAVDSQTGGAVDFSKRRVLTVEGLFDYLNQLYAEGTHQLVVKYDAADGHPVSAEIDMDQRVLDGGVAVDATAFQALP